MCVSFVWGGGGKGGKGGREGRVVCVSVCVWMGLFVGGECG